jgi:uncharacterized protein YcfJ
MESNQVPNQVLPQAQAAPRLHPLMATAAVSVILVSLLGAATFAGLLPSSNGTNAAQVAANTPAGSVDHADQKLSADASPTSVKEILDNKPTPHREHAQRQPAANYRQHANVAQAEPTYAQAPAYRAPAPVYREPAPAYREPAPVAQPVAQNSAVGIGVGALVGGLLGSQVGGGSGRTLAAIAGAIGGGYVGNEVAKNR